MSDAGRDIPSPRLAAALSWCRANRHFLAAAVLLGSAAIGWSVAVRVLKIVTRKEAVPWPAGVAVDEEFGMTSLPEKLGPYEFVAADGEIHRDPATGQPVKDGRPDGDVSVDEETMELLKIGTSTDEKNLPERKSNWLAIRQYRDSRVPPRQPFRYWRAEIYYYTGGGDLVPHIPEICGPAGGAVHLGSDSVQVSLPGTPGPWGGGPVEFRQARFQKTELNGTTSQYVQYYVFSLNGRPESSRNVVRLKLTSPFVRHAYFAKIQFAPLGPVVDQREADKAAKEFARHFLPEALKVLPMPADMERLGPEAADRE
jgi:hypothetical protein